MNIVENNFLLTGNIIKVRAVNVAELINIRSLRSITNIYNNPVIVKAGLNGAAVVQRFGSIVFFNATPSEQQEFITSIEPNFTGALKDLTSEEIDIQISSDAEFTIINNSIRAPRVDIGTMIVLADTMAKSVTLERIENSIAKSFEMAELLSKELQTGRINNLVRKNLLKQMGDLLIKKQGLFNRMELHDKPDLLWDNPNLETIYRNLSNEYELSERQSVIVKKLDLVLSVTQTGFDIIQTERSLRVEWYIVILIVFDIVLSLKDWLFS